jgi:hypothetical protein
MTNKDQTVLDIVTALNREFRFNPNLYPVSACFDFVHLLSHETSHSVLYSCERSQLFFSRGSYSNR